jgi:hypothetical protein
MGALSRPGKRLQLKADLKAREEFVNNLYFGSREMNLLL